MRALRVRADGDEALDIGRTLRRDHGHARHGLCKQ